MKTPNYYLFRDFSAAMINSRRVSEFRAEISGLSGPGYFADYLICFGGEEFQTPFNIAQLSWAEKSLAWFTEDPYEIDINKKNQHFFDLILTTDEKSISKYREGSSFLPLATPKVLFDELGSPEKVFDIFLFGSLWPNRISLLDQIVSDISSTNYRILLITSQLNASWVDPQRIKQIFSIIEKHNGRVVTTNRPFSLEQLKHFAQISRLCINWPRKFVDDKWSVPGPRVFEIASSGTVQFIDVETQPGVKTLIPDGSYVEYNKKTLVDKLREHLIETVSAKDFGVPLFEFVKENHTWEQRASSLLDLCEREISK
jgi:spore maturation protein CgeB